jgi:hypothetical protein
LLAAHSLVGAPGRHRRARAARHDGGGGQVDQVAARPRQTVGTRLDGRDIQDRRGRLAWRTAGCSRHDEEDQEPAGHDDWLDIAGEGLAGVAREASVCALNPLGLS